MIKIELLHALLVVELALIFFVLTIFLFFRNRKHKDLYLKTLRKLNDLKSERSTETLESPRQAREAFAESMPETPPERILEKIPESVPESVEEMPPQPAPIESLETVQPGGDESVPEQGKLRRLQRMVTFQKSTIVELMCYKDLFEEAKNRLVFLHKGNHELQDKIKGLAEGGIEGAGLEEAAAAIEANNNELEKFIAVLDTENTTLSGKFQVWEDEFRRIAEDAGMSVETPAMDETAYAEMLKEKDVMAVKIREFEEKIEEKSKLLASMQSQYEDLEKEYMILYRQQQQQQEGAQPAT